MMMLMMLLIQIDSHFHFHLFLLLFRLLTSLLELLARKGGSSSFIYIIESCSRKAKAG